MGDTVLYEADDAVATLTLNRPERLNTITPELIEDFARRWRRRWRRPEVRAIRLRGAGRAFCAGYDIGWGVGVDAGGRGGAALGPDRRLPDDAPLRRRLHGAVALAQARRRPGARLLRRRRHGLRAVLGPHRLRRGLPHRLPAGARVGLADDGDVDVPPRAGALQAPAADRRRDRRAPRGRVGAGVSEAVPAAELDDGGPGARAARRAAAPQPAAHDEAAGQPGLRADGPAHDAAHRHAARRRRAPHARGDGLHAPRPCADVRGAVADRDAPFGDYGQEPRDARRSARPGDDPIGACLRRRGVAGPHRRRQGACVELEGGRCCTTRPRRRCAPSSTMCAVGGQARRRVAARASTSATARSGWRPRSRAIRSAGIVPDRAALRRAAERPSSWS